MRLVFFNTPLVPLIILCFGLVFLEGCSASARQDRIMRKLEEDLPEEIQAALSNIPDRFSESEGMKGGEQYLIDLAIRIPGFAGFHLDRQQDLSLADDKVIVSIKGRENATEKAKKQALNHVNRLISRNDNIFDPEDVEFHLVEFSFIELQAYRDIVWDRIVSEVRFTSFDLDEYRNRVVIGVPSLEILNQTEKLIASTPVPGNAVVIEIAGGFHFN